MITLSEFVHICPQLKDDYCIIVSFHPIAKPTLDVPFELYKTYSEEKINRLNIVATVSYKELSDYYNFKKIQVVKVERLWIGYENGEEYWQLTLKHIKED